MRRAVKWTGGSLVGLAVLLTAVIAFAHTRPGRPVLRLLSRVYWPKGAGCPFGYDKIATPAQRTAAQLRFARTHAGAALAKARPALGFTFDVTRRSDVLAWAKANHVACSPGANGNDLGCTQVPGALIPIGAQALSAGALWFDFGRDGALISLVAVRRAPTAAQISAAFAAFTSSESRATGSAAFATTGNGSAAWLSGGLLRQASAEFRARDYYALARATHMTHDYLLTETYRSLAPAPDAPALSLR